MPNSLPMKRWSQGELNESRCRNQVALLLYQGRIVPPGTSHAAAVVFARQQGGMWRFCLPRYSGLTSAGSMP